MKNNPELGWALSKIYEYHLKFNGWVNVRQRMFNQKFCYIEMVNFYLSLWKVYRISTQMPLVTILLPKIDLYECMKPHKLNEYRWQNEHVLSNW